MYIQAVNSINFRGNNNHKYKGDMEVAPVITEYSAPKSSGMGKALPVVVLMAMQPSLLNAKLPENFNEIPETRTEYVTLPQAQQTENYPLGWRIFSSGLHQIRMCMPTTIGGRKFNLVFTSPQSKPNSVEDVYLVDASSKGSKVINEHPPEVDKFIYHDLGDPEKNFGSVRYSEDIIGPDGKAKYKGYGEFMLEEAAAQKIIDLLSNDTEWKNETIIPVEIRHDTYMKKPVYTKAY